MRFKEFKLIEASDPDVVQVQGILKDLGYSLGPTGVDGILGPYTQAAIDKYRADQKSDTGVGLRPDKPSGTGLKPNGGSIGLKLPADGRISGEYGRMVRGPNGNMIPHPGVDIAAGMGSPVRAPNDGTVVLTVHNNPSAGNFVEFMTTSGEKHRFLHLSKIAVSKGDRLKAGDVVGTVGSTGYSTGPHLHWEKYASNGQQVNPLG